MRERCLPARQAAGKVKETCWTVGVIAAFEQWVLSFVSSGMQ